MTENYVWRFSTHENLSDQCNLTYDPRRWIFLPFQQSIRLSEGARKIDEDKERQRRHLEAERVMKERETRYVHWLEVNDDC